MATAVKRPTGRQEILDAVLDAAERRFAVAGPADVSLRTIADDARVNYGLVHRHFGTKSALFEALLQRYADRWAARLDELDYDGALELLLGPSPDTGPYLRLLAWTLLSDRDDEQAHAHSRHSTLDQLPALSPDVDADTADMTTAAALAFVFGWRFFNPFIRDALHLDLDDASLQNAMRYHLRRIVSG